MEHVVGDDGWSAAWVALAVGGVQAFQGGFADVLAFGLGHGGEEGEQQAAGPGGVVDPGEWSGEHLQDEAVGGEVVGERGEFGGVTAEALHLVDGPGFGAGPFSPGPDVISRGVNPILLREWPPRCEKPCVDSLVGVGLLVAPVLWWFLGREQDHA